MILPSDMTIGECYDPAMAITDQAEADNQCRKAAEKRRLERETAHARQCVPGRKIRYIGSTDHRCQNPEFIGSDGVIIESAGVKGTITVLIKPEGMSANVRPEFRNGDEAKWFIAYPKEVRLL